MWHTSSGKVVYDPYRGELKKKKHWWCVINIDREITRYYRWWIVSQLHVKGMCQPSWNAHISVIRGEKPRQDLMHLWKQHNNKYMEFRYSHIPYAVPDTENGGFYWMIDVECEEALQIRRDLHRPVNWKLHLTLGRTWF